MRCCFAYGQRSCALLVAARYCGTSTAKETASSPVKTKPSVRGDCEELVKMRAKVTVTEPVKPESMQTFRDIRPPPANETVEQLRRRLIYQSRYRGMVEMDIIFGSFARERLDTFEREKLQEYDTLLRQFDNDLFNWLVMSQPAPETVTSLKIWNEIVTFVAKNKDSMRSHQL